LKVKVVNNQLDKAIKTLNKKLKQEGILQELKKRSYYEKPSEKKKRTLKEAIRRYRKLQRVGE
jgi:small subunit ribosomal protein S21